MTSYRPLATDAVADHIARQVSRRVSRQRGRARVAVDGAPPTDPVAVAEAAAEALRHTGRAAEVVRASSFWRDASLRYERGREDAEEYLSWLDADALRREVLDPFVAAGRYLPSLRDPATNRSTHEPPRVSAPDTVLIVAGQFLLGLALPFEATVHLSLSPAALERQTAAAQRWTLPAFARYAAQAAPAQRADIVIKLDDPRHPAVRC